MPRLAQPFGVRRGLAWVSVPLSLALHAALILWFGISGPWLARRLTRGRPPRAVARPAATA